MMRITEEYRALQEQMHAKGNYGVTAHRHQDKIINCWKLLGLPASVLDYGSGRYKHVDRIFQFQSPSHVVVQSYDPAVPDLAAEPRSAGMLVCCDVLEHVEKDCLWNVLEHMSALTQRGGFITIGTAPAKKMLPDGRNAHILLKSAQWWLDILSSKFMILKFDGTSPAECEFWIKKTGGNTP